MLLGYFGAGAFMLMAAICLSVILLLLEDWTVR